MSLDFGDAVFAHSIPNPWILASTISNERILPTLHNNGEGWELTFRPMFFFFWFPTVFTQGFQLETNHYLCRMGPRKGKALAQKILFKVFTYLYLNNEKNIFIGFFLKK